MEDVHTAKEIAAALGRSSRAVYRSLASVPPSGRKVVKGEKLDADAWSVSALPLRMRRELDAIARRQGCRDGAHLLQSPVQPWKSSVPLAEVPERYREQAVKDCAWLAPILAIRDQLPESEFQDRAAAEYARVFGSPMKAAKLNRLITRTVERDRFQENWQRVELYLDDEAFHRREPTGESLKAMHLHRPLDEFVRHLDSAETPSLDDKSWLLDKTFHHFERLVDGKSARERRGVKRSLIDYLHKAVPGLSDNAASLRRLFDHSYQQWTANGKCRAALEDRRRLNSGNFRTPDFSEDFKKIRNLAVRLNGNESQAHRKLRKEGQLSEEFCAYYDFDMRRNKSYVPRKVRQAVTGDVEIALPYFRGPKQARLAAPHIQRDWSDAVPGDIFTSDDVSWNHYWWDEGEDGKPYITRGECLLFTDELTDVPLSFSLHGLENLDPSAPQKRRPSYNATHIRRGMLKVHDDHGLPDIGWRFEGGTWQARLITGDKITGALHLHWRETESNCGGRIFDGRDAMKVFHARTARAKVIERTLRSLQEEMRTDPAFVGFNERKDNLERIQKVLRQIRNGSEHPGNLGIPHRDKFTATLKERLKEFMHEPQNGKRHRGATPWELWQERITRKPLDRMDDNARWVFASHFQRLRIRDGRIPIQGMIYSNEATVDWNNREVMAFFNIECPEVLVFSDLKRTEFFAVKSHVLPSRKPTPEQFKAARRDLGAYNRKARAIYHSVQHPIRSNVVHDDHHGETTKQIGRLVNEEVLAHREGQNAEQRQLSEIRRLSKLLGRPVRSHMRHPETVLRGLQKEIALNESLKGENTPANE